MWKILSLLIALPSCYFNSFLSARSFLQRLLYQCCLGIKALTESWGQVDPAAVVLSSWRRLTEFGRHQTAFLRQEGGNLWLVSPLAVPGAGSDRARGAGGSTHHPRGGERPQARVQVQTGLSISRCRGLLLICFVVVKG